MAALGPSSCCSRPESSCCRSPSTCRAKVKAASSSSPAGSFAVLWGGKTGCVTLPACQPPQRSPRGDDAHRAPLHLPQQLLHLQLQALVALLGGLLGAPPELQREEWGCGGGPSPPDPQRMCFSWESPRGTLGSPSLEPLRTHCPGPPAPGWTPKPPPRHPLCDLGRHCGVIWGQRTVPHSVATPNSPFRAPQICSPSSLSCRRDRRNLGEEHPKILSVSAPPRRSPR